MPALVAASHAASFSVAPERKVLVIDDSALIREAAKIALGTIGGWRVETAACGEEGIERARAERFDAILLDMVMPGMDGIAVAERLYAIPETSSTPVVLLTAEDRLQENARFRALPDTAIISKPFQVSDLSDELAVLLGWPT